MAADSEVGAPLGALLVVSQLIHLDLADGLLAHLGKSPDDLKRLRQTTFTPSLLGATAALRATLPCSSGTGGDAEVEVLSGLAGGSSVVLDPSDRIEVGTRVQSAPTLNAQAPALLHPS